MKTLLAYEPLLFERLIFDLKTDENGHLWILIKDIKDSVLQIRTYNKGGSVLLKQTELTLTNSDALISATISNGQ